MVADIGPVNREVNNRNLGIPGPGLFNKGRAFKADRLPLLAENNAGKEIAQPPLVIAAIDQIGQGLQGRQGGGRDGSLPQQFRRRAIPEVFIQQLADRPLGLGRV